MSGPSFIARHVSKQTIGGIIGGRIALRRPSRWEAAQSRFGQRCKVGALNSLPRVLGEGWGGGLEAVLNLCENRLCLHQRFAIGKTQHAKPALGEPLCARLVPCALIFVLPAMSRRSASVCSRRSRRARSRGTSGELIARNIRTRKRRSKQASGASSLDPHPNPPPKHWGGSQARYKDEPRALILTKIWVKYFTLYGNRARLKESARDGCPGPHAWWGRYATRVHFNA